jgi:hypothetical protein
MSTWTAEDGTVINYQVIGSKQRPALLLLPGLLGSIQTQWPLLPRPWLRIIMSF